MKRPHLFFITVLLFFVSFLSAWLYTQPTGMEFWFSVVSAVTFLGSVAMFVASCVYNGRSYDW